jgi:hypothetical protein
MNYNLAYLPQAKASDLSHTQAIAHNLLIAVIVSVWVSFCVLLCIHRNNLNSLRHFQDCSNLIKHGDKTAMTQEWFMFL